MYQANLYSKNNDLHQRGTECILKKYLHLMDFKEGENFLDIGFGDGEVLMNVVVPKLQVNYGKLVGIDRSGQMVDFARAKYGNDDRINFVKLNALCETVPKDLQGEFHHVFSFYCFHWIPDQKAALRNVYKMLRPGGDFLISILCDVPIFDTYENMLESVKWGSHLHNIKNNYSGITPISPYHHCKNPRKVFEQLSKEVGFEKIECSMENITYNYPSFSIYQDFVTAIDPYIGKLPVSKQDEYIKDLREEIRRVNGNIKIESPNNNTNEGMIHMNYTVLIAYGSKPL